MLAAGLALSLHSQDGPENGRAGRRAAPACPRYPHAGGIMLKTMPSRSAAAISLVLVSWLHSSAAAAPLAGIVVDAAATPMGPYYPVASTGTAGVLLSVGGTPILLELSASPKKDEVGALLPISFGTVYFKDYNCTGAAWVSVPDARPGVAAAAIVASPPPTLTA